MKAVLIIKKDNGDFLALPWDLSDVHSFTMPEIFRAITVKNYCLDREIRDLLDTPEPPEKGEPDGST